jgi:hypothetical protein
MAPRKEKILMKRTRFGILGLAVLLAVCPAMGSSATVGSAAPDFSINDQYDHPIQLSSYRGKSVLIIYGDRKGSDYMGVWLQAVRPELRAAGVKIIQAANLKTVPGFMEGFVKRKFLGKTTNGQPSPPVILDWNGQIASAYGFRDSVTNVYLIDGRGILRFEGSGKGSSEEARPLAEAMDALASGGNIATRPY